MRRGCGGRGCGGIPVAPVAPVGLDWWSIELRCSHGISFFLYPLWDEFQVYSDDEFLASYFFLLKDLAREEGVGEFQWSQLLLSDRICGPLTYSALKATITCCKSSEVYSRI